MNVKKALLLAAGSVVSFLALLTLVSVITKTATPKDLLILLRRERSVSREAEAGNSAAMQESQPRKPRVSPEASRTATSPTDSTAAKVGQKTAPRKDVKSDMVRAGKKSEQSLSEENSTKRSSREAENRLSNLVRLYNSMDANRVVSIMDSLSDSTALEILCRMRTRQAAKVLAAFPPGRAARITRLMTQSRR
ncbi:MAG: hypothetical protein J7J76_02305 [Candidatus Latescibacteria bacterium]|nr:hypothetical protein [Candidatus Latescibacterota bacterium]